jgi:hypothetical protein
MEEQGRELESDEAVIALCEKLAEVIGEHNSLAVRIPCNGERGTSVVSTAGGKSERLSI